LGGTFAVLSMEAGGSLGSEDVPSGEERRGTDGDQTISAVLTFNAGHDLVDFVSEDRTRASADGKTFTRSRWSTPLAGHRDTMGMRVLTVGEGAWHPAQPRGSLTYLQFHLDAITNNVANAETATTPPHRPLPAINGAGG
jgi:hypothetical protein